MNLITLSYLEFSNLYMHHKRSYKLGCQIILKKIYNDNEMK